MSLARAAESSVCVRFVGCAKFDRGNGRVAQGQLFVCNTFLGRIDCAGLESRAGFKEHDDPIDRLDELFKPFIHN